MGQTRRDTGAQRAAKRRQATRRACPCCGQQNAVPSRVGRVEGVTVAGARECRFTARAWSSYTDFTVSPAVTTEAPRTCCC
jgi:hypothetical protein